VTLHTTTPADGPTAAHAENPRVERFASTGELVKFAALAAVIAMLADAVVGHALLWHNDPYWTYWVTDTLLLATVFCVGTALVGAGVGRGAVLTAVQVVILTTYYWSLSPVGLPTNPEWLDLQHTWVTGPPVHFGVYYLGYLVALWLWRRKAAAAARDRTAQVDDLERHLDVAVSALFALATAAGLVLSVGLVQTVVLQEFPGVTWFVMRTVVLVPFTLGWWALAGRDRVAAVAGGMLAALVLLAYGHYLGPIGLLDPDLRLIAQDPPPADVHWLTYREEFLVMGPVVVAISVLGFWLAARAQGQPRSARVGFTAKAGVAVGLVAVIAAGFLAAEAVEPGDRTVRITARGQAQATVPSAGGEDRVAVEADLVMRVTQANTNRSPLPPHDLVALDATVTHPDGTRYAVSADRPLVSEPGGRFTTWGGVDFDAWHHGRSGIGLLDRRPVRSEVTVLGLGTVRADGALVASGVPVHAMTVAGGGLELHLGDRTGADGQLDAPLRVVWDQREGVSPEGPERARNLLGSVVLVLLLLVALRAARSDPAATGAPR
jgi:hypothetical protein